MGEERGGIPFCVNHPGAKARARCVSCGKYICERCLRELQAKALCLSCWEKARVKSEAGDEGSQGTQPPSLSGEASETCRESAPFVSPGVLQVVSGPAVHHRPVGATVYTYCSYHPGVKAIARCVNCGAFLCAQCRRIIQGRRYCQDCYNFLVDGRAAAIHPPPPLYGYHSSSPPPPSIRYPMGHQGETSSHPTPGYPYAHTPLAGPAYSYLPPTPRRRSALETAQWKLWPGILFLPVPFAVNAAITYLMNKGPELTLGAVILLLSTVLYTMFTFFAVITVSRYGAAAESLGLVAWDIKSSLGLGLAGGVVCYWLSAAFALLSYAALHNLEWMENWLEGLFEVNMKSGVSGVDLFIAFLLIVVAAPICEEIFFRGYLYPPMRRVMGRGAAIILNSLLFSIVHFSLFGLMSRMVAGCVFCLLYEYKENLMAPIVAHAINNFIAFMLPLITLQSMRLLRFG